MHRVEVKPDLFRWARERAGLSADALARRFPKLEAWERGELHPTLKQLERFAKATYAPVGFLFLDEPPFERVPIPDYRRVAQARRERPSPDLLDTIYLCQQRQDWYREFARSTGERPLDFVGSARIQDDVVATAGRIRHTLGFDVEKRWRLPTWTEALRQFIAQADALGVLVMVSGVVGSNTQRTLDPDEFRGFALADPLAPLVFVNGADTKAAQMFSLGHELAHIWLGQSAVSDAQAVAEPDQETERWCNRVAAELWAAYEVELARLREMPRGSGGSFYLSLPARVSKRFARALLVSTLEGRTSFTESFLLLGVQKMATFQELGHSLGKDAERGELLIPYIRSR
jgi:Zn-dependent peptidase ImmA (M78 family)